MKIKFWWDFLKSGIYPLSEYKKIQEQKDIVMRFIDRVEQYQDSDPNLAYRFLAQATKIYHNKLGGYIPENNFDRRFNDVFLAFEEKYPPSFNFR
jgi:hypothetical protein